jgi:hypothetical protein
MPQAIDLVVKNGAATPVDKTFTLLSPSAGYGSIAEWALKEGSISSVFPRFTAAATRNPGRSSKSRLKITVPASYTDSVTGLTNVGEIFTVDINVTVPEAFPEALKNDAVAFTANLVNHTMVKQLIRDGLSAT